MRRPISTIASGLALVVAASLAACDKPASTTATTDAAGNVTASAANGAANVTDAAAAGTAKAVQVTQDAASAVVGPLSAATAGSLSAAAFVDNAAQSDMFEIEAAKMALERSKSTAIKSFARKMIAGHGETTATIKAMVAAGKTGDAKLPDGLDHRRQGLIDNLKAASDADFDARYLDQQQAAHREAHILMAGYAAAGQNADLKAFAAKTAPVVEGHLKMAEALDRHDADHDKPSDAKS